MNNIKFVTLTCYFEVSDAEIYGGEGSVGYTSISLGDIKADTTTTNLAEVVEGLRKSVASSGMMNVDVSKVRCISKAEYESNTEDEDEPNDDDLGDW